MTDDAHAAAQSLAARARRRRSPRRACTAPASCTPCCSRCCCRRAASARCAPGASRPTATPGADALREHAANLSGAARLPWFELLLARMAAQPLAARQELLQATRRVMGARGVARPIDRLHWLAMRRGLGEVAPLAARAESHVEVAEWLESDVLSVAAYTAFLSRMVPGDERRRAGGPRLVRRRDGDLAAVRRDPGMAAAEGRGDGRGARARCRRCRGCSGR